MSTPDNPAPVHDLRRLIAALDHHGVEYLLVGGAAARAYGGTRLTEDADCVVRRDRANLDRLAAALRELRARLRVAGMSDDEARLLPVQLDGPMLAAATFSTWMTDAGGFDVLPGLVAADGRLLPYEELTVRENVIEGEGFEIRVAGLDDIIAAKEHADRPKDQEALPELRALRREAQRLSPGDPGAAETQKSTESGQDPSFTEAVGPIASGFGIVGLGVVLIGKAVEALTRRLRRR